MARILGIESSCDETGIAIYDTNHGLLANLLNSQVKLHQLYGGVVPELASRDHLSKIMPLIDRTLLTAQCKLSQLDALAYTAGPGLNGALLVGATIANTLGFANNLPVIPIHHLEGHILSPLLDYPELLNEPFIALLVSGGHTQLIAVHTIGNYQILGDTLDDAAGEAFDKTAKMLGLPYPGGPALATLAQTGIVSYPLPRPMLNRGNLAMSFSGLKTAVLTLINQLKQQKIPLIGQTIANIAASVEAAIVEVLIKKSQLALQQTGMSKLVVAGGVSANLTLRAQLRVLAKKYNYQIIYPPLNLCTDNGAMIAFAGAQRFALRSFNYSFTVHPRWELIENRFAN